MLQYLNSCNVTYNSYLTMGKGVSLVSEIFGGRFLVVLLVIVVIILFLGFFELNDD